MTSSSNDILRNEEDEGAMVIIARRQAKRLDKFIAEELPERSRAELATRIKAGDVLLNGHVAKPSDEVLVGDEILVPDPVLKVTDVTAEAMDLDIIYEDSDLLVVNKPSGLVTHPGSGNWSGTLLNGLLAHTVLAPGEVARAGIVHRIDKDTSGLLVVAKSEEALKGLSEQFAAHTITREYLALCEGVLPADSGRIEAPLGRDPRDRQRFAVREGGKQAVTHFKVRERFREATLVSCRLETGRTHQIRVHLAYIGHPVLNDPIYARSQHSKLDPSFGQFLHASVLGFIHPLTGKTLTFTSPLPPYFAQVIEELRKLNS